MALSVTAASHKLKSQIEGLRSLFLLYNEIMPEVKYAIYPGTVTLQDGSTKTWTAIDLAAVYGLADEDYLVVNNPTEIPQGMAYFEYIHLAPRDDDKYIDMKAEVEDVYRPDFDAKKRYTEETDPEKIDEDLNDDLDNNINQTGVFK